MFKFFYSREEQKSKKCNEDIQVLLKQGGQSWISCNFFILHSAHRIIQLFVRLNAATLLVIVAWTACWASTDETVKE